MAAPLDSNVQLNVQQGDVDSQRSKAGALVDAVLLASIAAAHLSSAATSVLAVSELVVMPQLEMVTRLDALAAAELRVAALARQYEMELQRLQSLSAQLTHELTETRTAALTARQAHCTRLGKDMSSNSLPHGAVAGTHVVTRPSLVTDDIASSNLTVEPVVVSHRSMTCPPMGIQRSTSAEEARPFVATTPESVQAPGGHAVETPHSAFPPPPPLPLAKPPSVAAHGGANSGIAAPVATSNSGVAASAAFVLPAKYDVLGVEVNLTAATLGEMTVLELVRMLSQQMRISIMRVRYVPPHVDSHTPGNATRSADAPSTSESTLGESTGSSERHVASPTAVSNSGSDVSASGSPQLPPRIIFDIAAIGKPLPASDSSQLHPQSTPHELCLLNTLLSSGKTLLELDVPAPDGPSIQVPALPHVPRPPTHKKGKRSTRNTGASHESTTGSNSHMTVGVDSARSSGVHSDATSTENSTLGETAPVPTHAPGMARSNRTGPPPGSGLFSPVARSHPTRATAMPLFAEEAPNDAEGSLAGTKTLSHVTDSPQAGVSTGGSGGDVSTDTGAVGQSHSSSSITAPASGSAAAPGLFSPKKASGVKYMKSMFSMFRRAGPEAAGTNASGVGDTRPSSELVPVCRRVIQCTFDEAQLDSSSIEDLVHALSRRVGPSERLLQVTTTGGAETPGFGSRKVLYQADLTSLSPAGTGVSDTATPASSTGGSVRTVAAESTSTTTTTDVAAAKVAPLAVSLRKMGLTAHSTVEVVCTPTHASTVAGSTDSVPLASEYVVDCLFTEEQLRTTTIAVLHHVLSSLLRKPARAIEIGGVLVFSNGSRTGILPTSSPLWKAGAQSHTAVFVKL